MTVDFEFNNKLISIINKRIPKKSDQMVLLMNKMAMGREAAYRRLRGDVSFSFAEACIISRELGISLDLIATAKLQENPVFELKIHPADLAHYEFHKLFEHEDSFDMLTGGSVSIIQTACNIIPYSFFFPYEYLSKFRLFKWRYQTEQKLTPSKFSDIILPESVRKKQIELGVKVMEMPETSLIFDRNMFSSFADEMKYFYDLNLISDEEFEKLKSELILLVEDLEYVAIQGKNNLGMRAWVYLSNIDFDCSYTYVKGIDFELAYMDGIYMMDTIVSSDPQICKIHREWIESLRKYSTLISVSGEMGRKAFFDKEKTYIRNL